MRGATECAKRLKLLVSSLRSKLGKLRPPETTDPITQVILGVLARDTPEERAAEALARLRAMVVDYNELRVIPPLELADVLADMPHARLKAEDISRALNSIFATEHSVTLDRVRELNKKEMLAVLAEIDGLEAYSRARIRRLGLGVHAIPLDEAMWAYARAQQIVDQRCPLEEAQAFLERQIAPDDALEFIALIHKQGWAEQGSAVEDGAVERIESIPPDRTTRNMLRMVSISAAETADAAAGELGEPATATESAASPERKPTKEPAAKPSRKHTPRKPAQKATAKRKSAKSAKTGKTPKKKSPRKAPKRKAAARQSAKTSQKAAAKTKSTKKRSATRKTTASRRKHAASRSARKSTRRAKSA
jgi:endonuclease III